MSDDSPEAMYRWTCDRCSDVGEWVDEHSIASGRGRLHRQKAHPKIHEHVTKVEMPRERTI